MSQLGLESQQKTFQPLATSIQQQTPEQLCHKADESIQQFNIGEKQFLKEAIDSVLSGLSTNNFDGMLTEENYLLQRVFFFIAPVGTGKAFVTPAIQQFL